MLEFFSQQTEEPNCGAGCISRSCRLLGCGHLQGLGWGGGSSSDAKVGSLCKIQCWGGGGGVWTSAGVWRSVAPLRKLRQERAW